MDASPSSLELAARLVPARASRSAPRASVETVALRAIDEHTTTTAAPTTTVPTTVVTVKKAATAASAAPAATTKTTTKKPKPTTTTKPKPKATTTTTAKPAPKAASAPPKLRTFTPPAAGASTGQSETGQATWYETDDPVVCAHKTIPLGTVVTVTNVDTGKSTTCKVGDRGPFVEGRIIDLSPEAFSQLASLSAGVINVKLTW